MLAAMAVALAAANSPLRSLYQAVHHAPIELRIGPFGLYEPAIGWINEGLMVFFFLLVGLEIKREVREGVLASPRRAALPLIAALGGMAVPALIYVAFTAGDPVAVRGWAIPTATDIVLALGVLAFLGDRAPPGLKVFITALAIFDDLGGVVLVGLFYGSEIARYPLAVAALAATALAVLTWMRAARAAPFVVLGLLLWVAMLKSGIPAALAGVVIAFAVPMRSRDGATSPLRAAEHALQPWVALVVIPTFAFFNAGIAIDAAGLAALQTPVALRDPSRTLPRQAPGHRRCDVARRAGPSRGTAAGRRVEARARWRRGCGYRLHAEPVRGVARIHRFAPDRRRKARDPGPRLDRFGCGKAPRSLRECPGRAAPCRPRGAVHSRSTRWRLSQRNSARPASTGT